MKEIQFKGKVAVVTGAASGMGLRTSQEFARLGAKVVMCDLDEARLRQEVEKLRVGGVEVVACAGDGVGAMYGTAKSGLFNFVKGLAVAGGPHNVRAVCVTPGPILTRAAMSGMPTILGRAGETHELVDVILFMCSENASFITGTNHIVDGGRLLMFQPYVAPKNG